MKEDFSAVLSQLYAQHHNNAALLNRRHVIEAALVVEKFFPPANARAAFSILAALNLLNACVKMSWGYRMVTYGYIKGMAACLLTRQIYLPISDLSVYMDLTENVAYFRVLGVQFSFHYLPMYKEMLQRLHHACREEQQWDGVRLQKVAVEVFRLACPWRMEYSEEVEEMIGQRLLRFKKPSLNCIFGNPRPWPFAGGIFPMVMTIDELPEREPAPVHSTPFLEEKALALTTALKFNIWDSDLFILFRRKDRHNMPVVRYTGRNYQQMMSILSEGGNRLKRRKEKTLVPGKLYRVSPLKLIKTISPSRHILSLTQNNYLRTGNIYHNLCVTYGIALYLASQFSSLRFVCTLNYNRLSVRHHYYRKGDLCRVPLKSKARMLKVWIPIDTYGLLKQFDVGTLPKHLVDEYMEAEDYYQEFEITTAPNGLKGLYAYRRHHLLPAIYEKIVLRNYHARVKNHEGKWAIYSLNQECFKTDFIYNRIWYDSERAAIIGQTDYDEQVLAKMRLRQL